MVRSLRHALEAVFEFAGRDQRGECLPLRPQTHSVDQPRIQLISIEQKVGDALIELEKMTQSGGAQGRRLAEDLN